MPRASRDTGEPRHARLPNSPLLITLSRTLVLGLGLVTAPVLARSLGPADRGTYAALIALLALAPVLFGLGMPMALRRRAALATDVSDTYRTIYRALPVVIVGSVAISWVVGMTLLSDRSAIERALFTVCVAMACLFVLVLCVQSSLVIAHRYRGIAVLQGTQGAITSGLVIGLWLGGWLSVMSLEIVYLVATATAVVAALVLGAPSARGPAAPRLPLLRESAAFLGTQIADTATPSVPVIAVFALLTADQAGYFSVAMTIASVPVAVAYAIGSVVYRAIAVSDGDERLAVAQHAVRSSLISGLVVCGALAAITPWGLPTLFGSQFRTAVTAALVLTASAVLSLISYVCMQILSAAGRPGVMTTWQSVGLATGVVLVAALGPAFLVTGAAVGVLIGSAVTAVGSVRAIGLSWSVLWLSSADITAAVRLIARGDVTSVHRR